MISNGPFSSKDQLLHKSEHSVGATFLPDQWLILNKNQRIYLQVGVLFKHFLLSEVVLPFICCLNNLLFFIMLLFNKMFSFV